MKFNEFYLVVIKPITAVDKTSPEYEQVCSYASSFIMAMKVLTVSIE